MLAERVSGDRLRKAGYRFASSTQNVRSDAFTVGNIEDVPPVVEEFAAFLFFTSPEGLKTTERRVMTRWRSSGGLSPRPILQGSAQRFPQHSRLPVA